MLYRDIDSLQNYVLINSEAVHAEVFSVNQKGLWELREYKQVKDNLQISSINVTLTLEEIYEGTKLV